MTIEERCMELARSVLPPPAPGRVLPEELVRELADLLREDIVAFLAPAKDPILDGMFAYTTPPSFVAFGRTDDDPEYEMLGQGYGTTEAEARAMAAADGVKIVTVVAFDEGAAESVYRSVLTIDEAQEYARGPEALGRSGSTDSEA